MKYSLNYLSLFGLTFAVCSICSCGSNAPVQQPIFTIPDPVEVPIPPEDNGELEPDPIDDGQGQEQSPVSIDQPAMVPTAKPIPGRPGFVFNPFTQNMVDVEGIPSGTKVRDPQDPNEKNLFIVP